MNNLKFEIDLWESKFNNIAGVDEAGRGPLAGPLVVAAVILNKEHLNRNNDVKHDFFSLYDEINDSKLIGKNKRKRLSEFIISNAVAYSIIEISPHEIDKVGIGEANRIGFTQAISRLRHTPDYVITDYFKLKHYKYEQTQLNLVKGDRLSISVAAASILAKVHRDEYMQKLHTQFPQYSFDKNKGYPTKHHKEMLVRYGPCTHHRRSFKLGIDTE